MAAEVCERALSSSILTQQRERDDDGCSFEVHRHAAHNGMRLKPWAPRWRPRCRRKRPPCPGRSASTCWDCGSWTDAAHKEGPASPGTMGAVSTSSIQLTVAISNLQPVPHHSQDGDHHGQWQRPPSDAGNPRVRRFLPHPAWATWAPASCRIWGSFLDGLAAPPVHWAGVAMVPG